MKFSVVVIHGRKRVFVCFYKNSIEIGVNFIPGRFGLSFQVDFPESWII